jgi:hypothetical protein
MMGIMLRNSNDKSFSMQIINLTEIQEYFSGNLVIFSNNDIINQYLSKETADILYNIGLPNHNTFGGNYEFFGNVELLDKKFLKIGTKNTFINEPFGLCIDIETQKIIGELIIVKE